jgi:hypothetical protein
VKKEREIKGKLKSFKDSLIDYLIGFGFIFCRKGASLVRMLENFLTQVCLK